MATMNMKKSKRISRLTVSANGPTPAELQKLRKDIDAVTAGFFKEYGDIYDYMMVCPPGPLPPPKLEERILNLGVV